MIEFTRHGKVVRMLTLDPTDKVCRHTPGYQQLCKNVNTYARDMVTKSSVDNKQHLTYDIGKNYFVACSNAVKVGMCNEANHSAVVKQGINAHKSKWGDGGFYVSSFNCMKPRELEAARKAYLKPCDMFRTHETLEYYQYQDQQDFRSVMTMVSLEASYASGLTLDFLGSNPCEGASRLAATSSFSSIKFDKGSKDFISCTYNDLDQLKTIDSNNVFFALIHRGKWYERTMSMKQFQSIVKLHYNLIKEHGQSVGWEFLMDEIKSKYKNGTLVGRGSGDAKAYPTMNRFFNGRPVLPSVLPGDFYVLASANISVSNGDVSGRGRRGGDGGRVGATNGTPPTVITVVDSADDEQPPSPRQTTIRIRGPKRNRPKRNRDETSQHASSEQHRMRSMQRDIFGDESSLSTSPQVDPLLLYQSQQQSQMMQQMQPNQVQQMQPNQVIQQMMQLMQQQGNNGFQNNGFNLMPGNHMPGNNGSFGINNMMDMMQQMMMMFGNNNTNSSAGFGTNLSSWSQQQSQMMQVIQQMMQLMQQQGNNGFQNNGFNLMPGNNGSSGSNNMMDMMQQMMMMFGNNNTSPSTGFDTNDIGNNNTSPSTGFDTNLWSSRNANARFGTRPFDSSSRNANARFDTNPRPSDLSSRNANASFDTNPRPSDSSSRNANDSFGTRPRPSELSMKLQHLMSSNSDNIMQVHMKQRASSTTLPPTVEAQQQLNVNVDSAKPSEVVEEVTETYIYRDFANADAGQLETGSTISHAKLPPSALASQKLPSKFSCQSSNSNYMGVFLHDQHCDAMSRKSEKIWQVKIQHHRWGHNYKTVHMKIIGLGSGYDLQCDAALAYDYASKQLRGPNALTNFSTLYQYQKAKEAEIKSTGLSMYAAMSLSPATIEAKVKEFLRKASTDANCESSLERGAVAKASVSNVGDTDAASGNGVTLAPRPKKQGSKAMGENEIIDLSND